MVLYMCSSFWLLGVESCDFSHAEKERTTCKAEQMSTIFKMRKSPFYTHFFHLKITKFLGRNTNYVHRLRRGISGSFFLSGS